MIRRYAADCDSVHPVGCLVTGGLPIRRRSARSPHVRWANRINGLPPLPVCLGTALAGVYRPEHMPTKPPM